MTVKKINDLEALSTLTKSTNYAIPILDLNDRDADGDPKLKQVPINLLQSLFKTETNLHKVATSGKYSDLKNLPQLFSGNYADLQGKPDLSQFLTQHQDISGKADKWQLFSQNYADLKNVPVQLTAESYSIYIGNYYSSQENAYVFPDNSVWFEPYPSNEGYPSMVGKSVFKTESIVCVKKIGDNIHSYIHQFLNFDLDGRTSFDHILQNSFSDDPNFSINLRFSENGAFCIQAGSKLPGNFRIYFARYTLLAKGSASWGSNMYPDPEQ